MHLGRQVEESRAEFFRELPSLFRVDSRRELLLEHPPVNERLRNLPHVDARIELASDAFHDDHGLLQKKKIGLEFPVVRHEDISRVHVRVKNPVLEDLLEEEFYPVNGYLLYVESLGPYRLDLVERHALYA